MKLCFLVLSGTFGYTLDLHVIYEFRPQKKTMWGKDQMNIQDMIGFTVGLGVNKKDSSHLKTEVKSSLPLHVHSAELQSICSQQIVPIWYRC